MADQGVVGAESRPATRGVLGWLGWAAAFVVLAIVVAATAEAGAWFVPFIVGAGAGVASLRWRRMVLLAVLASVTGWAIPLWLLAVAGLPPYAAVTIVATLLLAALQALAGAWLTRAFLPRRRPRT